LRAVDFGGLRGGQGHRSPRQERAVLEEIAQVGTISANGDKSLGKMIADAMQKVGNVTWSRSRRRRPL
jgi:chaperonin GroEL